jgi:hypothetical protein
LLPSVVCSRPGSTRRARDVLEDLLPRCLLDRHGGAHAAVDVEREAAHDLPGASGNWSLPSSVRPFGLKKPCCTRVSADAAGDLDVDPRARPAAPAARRRRPASAARRAGATADIGAAGGACAVRGEAGDGGERAANDEQAGERAGCAISDGGRATVRGAAGETCSARFGVKCGRERRNVKCAAFRAP